MSKSKTKDVTIFRTIVNFLIGPPVKWRLADAIVDIGRLYTIIWKNEVEERRYNDYLKAIDKLERAIDIRDHFKEGTREWHMASASVFDMQDLVIKKAKQA